MPSSLEIAERLQTGCLLEILSKAQFLNLGSMTFGAREIICLGAVLHHKM